MLLLLDDCIANAGFFKLATKSRDRFFRPGDKRRRVDDAFQAINDNHCPSRIFSLGEVPNNGTARRMGCKESRYPRIGNRCPLVWLGALLCLRCENKFTLAPWQPNLSVGRTCRTKSKAVLGGQVERPFVRTLRVEQNRN